MKLALASIALAIAAAAGITDSGRAIPGNPFDLAAAAMERATDRAAGGDWGDSTPKPAGRGDWGVR